MNILGNDIYTKKLGLDLPKLRSSSNMLYNHLKETFNKSQDHSNEFTFTTSLYKSYNLFLFPYPGFHELYHEIRNVFYELNDDPYGKFYISAWLNYYLQDEFINWHAHTSWDWHGFFCVDCEPSKTTYKVGTDLLDINSEDNLLIINKSNKPHRTWPWPNSDRPRITIAYNITRIETIDFNTWKDHWIPI